GAQFSDYLVNASLGSPFSALATFFVGNAKKKEMQRKHNLAIQNLNMANKMYGTAKTQFNNQQLSQYDYQNKANPYDRLTNLYMAQSGQQQ
ncbi:MAG: hypothetical protein KGJ87_11805, partial [Planctomycetota bacterium]|nr:hypothetical protein [Planctomycetota bacterium]